MRTLTMICAAAIAMCGTGQAQSFVDRIAVHFSTPVTVGETTLPAGECNIQVIRGSGANVVLQVSFPTGTAGSILVPVSRLSNSDVVTDGHATVILSHRDDGYHLDQIVLPDRTGFQVLD